jgi:UDP-N-acetylmuramoyl-tripeptide--D-alanyl-D-alanine ligase
MNINTLYQYYLKNPVICTDTRKITDGCLFFALKGENFNANTFAANAIEHGAAFAVIDDVDYQVNDRFLLVDDTLKALQDLSIHHRKQLQIPVIGLTGSNGKTTTKELINSVLSQKFITLATKGNLNNHIGVPLTILEITSQTEIAIIEMGANHQKEIAQLCRYSMPNYGFITNIGKAHLEGFGGVEGIKIGKGELYDYLKGTNGTTFINKDSEALTEMGVAKNLQNTLFYGKGFDNFLSGKLVKNDPFLEVEWMYKGDLYQVQSQLTGIYNFENILAAIAIGLQFGLTPNLINDGISTYSPQNNRSQILKTKSNTIICDYYNANPSSMTVAIDNILQLKADNKVLILADMFELGEEAFLEHEIIVKQALLNNAFSKVIFVGEYFKAHEQHQGALFFAKTEELANYLQKNKIENSLVLVKGSRGMKLESVIEYL